MLGVDRFARVDAIRRAYRDLARKLHPDVNRASDAAASFSVVQFAYSVLSDASKRANYDAQTDRASASQARYSSESPTGHYTWGNVAGRPVTVTREKAQSASDFEELYETFFARRERAPQARDG